MWQQALQRQMPELDPESIIIVAHSLGRLESLHFLTYRLSPTPNRRIDLGYWF
ncbi:hypothetical protein E0H89_02480 [Acinetobacter sp. ANC 3781]|nr:hypothetical protein E0H89_02480 [Acinetobacter sp. ANC 3781]